MKTEAKDVFRFKAYIDDWNILHPERTIYTNMFPEEYELDCPELEEKQETVKNLYFTPERIQKIKEEMCKKIMETPLTIECVDSDGGYRVEESELLENL